MLKSIVKAVAVAGLALGATVAAAQDAWPSKPIRIVVPYPAGGQTDGIARSFGDFLSRKLGQTVVVDYNRDDGRLTFTPQGAAAESVGSGA